MVAVAQLVESRIVIPAVVGSSPIGHPKKPFKINNLQIGGHSVDTFVDTFLSLTGFSSLHVTVRQ